MGMRRSLLFLASALSCVGCLAPPPPIVVETPFGDVRAASAHRASEVAELLERLAPEVRSLLPGVQERPVDVWVQEELSVYLFRRRPESVRGFTLLEGEFDAKRIHLQEGGQSPWYLAHELVHALIGPTWAPLPGILEEGLGDVVAEALNPEYQNHIRSHRLLNASAFTGGLALEVLYREPSQDRPWREWPERRVEERLQLWEPLPAGTLERLLVTPRGELHQRWTDIPECFYGISWLIVSRIVERVGLEGLHRLCLEASAQGLELVPLEWLSAAAEIDLAHMDPAFLASCFDRPTLQTALYLQPEPFAELALRSLAPLREQVSFRGLFRYARPLFLLPDGSEVPLGYYIGPLYSVMRSGWSERGERRG
jgi:hypothetical protein